MDKLIFSAIIGLIAGVIDFIPMIMQKLPRYSTVSAFFHYFFIAAFACITAKSNTSVYFFATVTTSFHTDSSYFS